jgi:hypothetical protein
MRARIQAQWPALLPKSDDVASQEALPANRFIRLHGAVSSMVNPKSRLRQLFVLNGYNASECLGWLSPLARTIGQGMAELH